MSSQQMKPQKSILTAQLARSPKTPTSKTHHKLLSWLVILLSLALSILTGCSNTGKPGSEASSTTTEASSEAASPTAAPELAEAASPTAAPASGEAASTPTEIAPPYEPIDEQVTVMVYLTGSDLESAAAAGTTDMQEMAESGIDLTRVNLLVFTGGAQLWHRGDTDTQNTSDNQQNPETPTIPEIPTDCNMLYHLTENGYEAVEQFDQLSMGDPANLARFLEYSYEHYPADSYDLILWDHGNGPVIGYGSDKQYDGDSLTLQELKEALAASPFGEKAPAPQRPEGASDQQASAPTPQRPEGAAGQQASALAAEPAAAPAEPPHLSLLGFDACLMSSAELACTVADYADYLVASQETEPSFGWNYSFLRLCGKVRSKDLATEIVRSYGEYCERYFAENEFFRSDYTLAVIDLAHTQELRQSLNTLFEKASEDVSGSYNKLAAARVRSHGFGRASTGSEYDLVDLESLAQQMEEKYPKEVADLRAALAKAVVTTKSNIGESCGLSLFYPYYNKNYYKKTWKTQYQPLAQDIFPDYNTYLSRYDQVWLGANLMEVYDGELTPQQGAGSGTYTLQLTPEQYASYASSRYIILRKISENLYTLVYISKDITDRKGLLTANFDGKVIYFEDNYGKKGIPFVRMYETVEGVTDFDCFAVATRKSDDPDKILGDRLDCDIQFAVNTATGEVTVKGIYEDEDEDSEKESAASGAGPEGPASGAADTITSGKRPPVNLSEWTALEFYEGGSHYLTRDDQGRILPYTEWPKSGWVTFYTMALANGLHFTYEPLYDDGNEYFVMFEVSDVQNNRVYSELMPITLAQAPPEELAKEATQIEWPGGSSVTILDDRASAPTNLFLELRAMRDQDYRKTTYMLHAINQNDFGVDVYLGDIYLNDTISYNRVGNNAFGLSLDPGEEKYAELGDIASILTFAGLTAPESLQFTLQADNQENSGHLIYNRPYYVKVTGEITPQVFAAPVLGARADSQVLYEENGVRIELKGLGDFSAYKGASATTHSLLAKAKFTNTSGKEQPVSILGLEVNGVFFGSLEKCTLQDGQSWDKALTLEIESLQTLESDFIFYDREPMLHEISEINLLVMVNDSILTLPIDLAEAGTQAPFEADGELLYENENIRVTLHSAGIQRKYNDKEACVWELWVENLSDGYKPYSAYMTADSATADSENDLYLNTTKLWPGTKHLVQITCYKEDLAADEIQLYFHSVYRESPVEYEQVPPTDLITLEVP